MPRKFHELISISFYITSINNKAISRSKRNDLFQCSSCSKFYWLHETLLILPLYFRRCFDIINCNNKSISRSIRNHVFPLLILFSVLLSATTSFNSFPSSCADGLTSFTPGVNQSQESSGETISTRSSAQLVSCPLYLFGNCLLFYRIDFDIVKDIFWTISIGKQSKIIYLFILFLFPCWNTSLHVLFYYFFLKTRISSIFTVF